VGSRAHGRGGYRIEVRHQATVTADPALVNASRERV